MKLDRTETDSMGEMQVPADALYGAQTARALENFPISGLRFPRGFIRGLGLIKKHAAAVNLELGLLDEEIGRAIFSAAQGRTTFIITHRLSQIRWADLIIVMAKGEVAAVGTHEDLLTTSEAYRRIFSE